MEEKCFYVLTALAKDDLAKVNTLLRGSLEIPVQLLLLQNVDTHVPYLATRRWETGMELGLKVIKGRTFRVARRKRL